jgi:hypothetical protein
MHRIDLQTTLHISEDEAHASYSIELSEYRMFASMASPRERRTAFDTPPRYVSEPWRAFSRLDGAEVSIP